MDFKQLEDINDSISLLEGLDLPFDMEQLGKRQQLETDYLNENVIPIIQTQIQALVENLHKPFCLVVDYQYGSPVQVRLAEKRSVKLGIEKKAIPRTRIDSKKYTSDYIQSEWNRFLESIPQGNTFAKFAISQSYSTLSKMLRTMQTQEMLKYTSSLFKILSLPTNGKITPTSFTSILEPEQFVQETTKDGFVNRIVLWSQSQKVVVKDGIRTKIFEADGVTPVMVDKTKKVKEGQWSLKTLCDLVAQKEYFARLHSVEKNQ